MRSHDGRRTSRGALTLQSAALLLAIAVIAGPRSQAQDRAAQDNPKTPAAAVVRTLEGRAVGKDDGKPIAGVTIEADPFRVKYLAAVVGATDADGVFVVSLPASPLDWVIVTATKEGLVTASKSFDDAALAKTSLPALTFSMSKGESVSGLVRDTRGRPIADAKVEILFTSKTEAAATAIYGASSASATTDREGRWRTSKLPPTAKDAEIVWFGLNHPGFAGDRGAFRRTLKVGEIRAGAGVLTMQDGEDVTGSIVDGEGRPVALAAVTLSFSPNAGDWLKTTSDTDGRYHFPHADVRRPGQLALSVEAKGFAPDVKSYNPPPPALPAQDFRLAPSKPLSIKVVDVSGNGLAGASVAINDFRGSREWGWSATTDQHGRMTWPDGPELGEVSFDVSCPPLARAMGRKVAVGGGQATIVLKPILHLKGTVADADTGKPIETFRFIPGWGPQSAGARVSWRRDGNTKTLHGGKFDELRTFPDQGMTRSLRIEAEGYIPANWIGFKDDEGELEHHFKLRKGTAMSGVVRGPDDEPLAGAEVWLDNSSYTARIVNGRVDGFARSDDMKSITNADGRYRFNPQDVPSGLIVLHDAGFAKRTAAEILDSPDITVESWGRVEGTVRVGAKVVANEPIRLSLDGTKPTSEKYEFYEYEARTDAAGRFTVDRVIPGYANATTGARGSAIAAASGSIGSGQFEVKPGEAVRITLGGLGRPVVGRFVVPNGLALPYSVVNGRGTLSLRIDQPKMPTPPDFASWPIERKVSYGIAWRTSPEVRAALGRARAYGVKLEPDGSFRADDVLPGLYSLAFSVTDPGERSAGSRDHTSISASASYELNVAEIPGGRTDETLDVGTVELKVSVTRRKSLEVGQAAPQFEGTTLDGKALKLADLRGKFILLDFWATWCGPCVEDQPSLVATHEALKGDVRFAMIGLSLDKQVEPLKAFVAARKLAWMQIHLGEWSDSRVASDYGVESIPSVWLIGPDGKVVAKDLSGDAIKDAVAKALAGN